MADDGAALRVRQRERSTSASAIYRDLQSQIVSMALKPGAALGEQMLADRYGVSRTPVREAIIRLSEERLVDVRPQQGTFVSRLDIALIPEAVVIRQALEGATVQQAARIATRKDLDRLDDILAEQRFHRDRNALERFMTRRRGLSRSHRLDRRIARRVELSQACQGAHRPGALADLAVSRPHHAGDRRARNDPRRHCRTSA